jgi:YD repeat-containing protein
MNVELEVGAWQRTGSSGLSLRALSCGASTLSRLLLGVLVVWCLLCSGVVQAQVPSTVRYWRIVSVNELPSPACDPQPNGPRGLSGYVTACRNAYYEANGAEGDNLSWTCFEVEEDGQIDYHCRSTNPNCNAYCGGERVEPVDLRIKDVTRAFDPPKTCGANPAAGNPIYPLTGVKRESVNLGLRIGGLDALLTYDTTPMVFDRNDAMAANVPSPKSKADPGVLGLLWSSNLHRKLVVQSGEAGLLVSRGDGRVASFKGSVANGYTSNDSDSSDWLEVYGGGFHYVDAANASIENYDASGRLDSIQWLSGETVTLGYSNASTPPSIAPGVGYLLQAQDTQGRSLQFRYSPVGRLTQIIDPAAQAIVLAYGPATGNLDSIQWADTKSRKFKYEDANFPWALTGIVDERDVRYANFAYGLNGNAVSTEHAGGVARYSVTYTSPPKVEVFEVYNPQEQVIYRYHQNVPPEGIVLSTPQTGPARDIASVMVNGKVSLSEQKQPAGSGCEASTRSLKFDANGNLESRDDFNQQRSCHLSDPARNLESARVEGLAPTTVCGTVTAAGAALPTGSRKLSTAWHPQWALRARQAEPRKITTWVYNGQTDPTRQNAIVSCAPPEATLPDGTTPIAVLCRQVEQATTDIDGRLGFSAALDTSVPRRETNWAYNRQGRVLSEDGPRTDITDVTEYEYHDAASADHAQGDLKTVRDAAGVVAEFTKYNKHGQVLESKDGNGVVTVNTYDERQRLRTSKTGTEQTTYTYDAVGQLTRVQQTDGSWVGFDHDDAHRLKAMHDLSGNRIEYELDNEGKRTGERAKDPQGALKRKVIRAMDALGRVQKTTVGQ